jgi:hypothetical protein
MKKNFKSIQELNTYLNGKLLIAMDGVGEKALNHMKNYIENKLKETEPKVYKRTWEYLNSIDRIKAHMVTGGSIETIIYYNTDKITPYLPSSVFNDWTGYEQDNGMTWGQHSDIYGNSIVEILPLWMEEGTDSVNGNFYPRKGLGGIIDLKEWVISNFRKELAIELRKQGIQTK